MEVIDWNEEEELFNQYDLSLLTLKVKEMNLNNIIHNNDYEEVIPQYVDPKPLRLSTSTMLSKFIINKSASPKPHWIKPNGIMCLDLNILYDSFPLDPLVFYIEKDKEGNNRIFDESFEAFFSKNHKKKLRKNIRNPPDLSKVNSFFNQVTFIVRDSLTSNKTINVKLCRNGTLQITGCSSLDIPVVCLQNLKNSLMKMDYFNQYSFEFSKPDPQLINMDFELGFPIDRPSLQELLSEEYDYISSFDETNYPGVNTKMPSRIFCKHDKHPYNSVKNEFACDCHMVSVFTFQTGKAIINSKRIECITECYEKMIQIIKENFDRVVQKQIVFKNEPVRPKRKYRKKSDILLAATEANNAAATQATPETTPEKDTPVSASTNAAPEQTSTTTSISIVHTSVTSSNAPTKPRRSAAKKTHPLLIGNTLFDPVDCSEIEFTGIKIYISKKKSSKIITAPNGQTIHSLFPQLTAFKESS